MRFNFSSTSRALAALGVLLMSHRADAQKAAEAKGALAAAGKWTVDFERLFMTHTDTTFVHGRARLVLAQQGDSLIGSWQRLEENGADLASPLDASGALHRDSLRLELTPIVDPDATFTNIAHDISSYLKEKIHGIVPMTTVLELVVRGDSLIGTVRSMSQDRATATPAGRVTATRIKS